MDKWSARLVLFYIAVFMVISDSLASEDDDYGHGLSTSISFYMDIDVPLDTGGADPQFLDEVLNHASLATSNNNARQQESPVAKKKPIKRERDSPEVEEVKIPKMLRPEIHYHILAGFSDLLTGLSASDIIKRLHLAVPTTKTKRDSALRDHYFKLQRNQGWLYRSDEAYYITAKGIKARQSLGTRYGLSVHTQGNKKLRITDVRDQDENDEDALDTPSRALISSQALYGEESSSISSDSSSSGSSEHINLPTRIKILTGDRTIVFEPATGRSITTYTPPPSNNPLNFAELPTSMKFIIMNISQKLLLPQLLSNDAFMAELRYNLINGLRFGLAQTLKGVGVINADRALETMIAKQVGIDISHIPEIRGDIIE